MLLSIHVAALLVCGFLSFSSGKAVPVIIKNKTEYIIDDGGDSEIHCEVPGDLKPFIRWEINGNFYDQMSNTSVNFNVSANASLVIANPVISKLYGLVNVTCIANNSAGTVRRTFKVVFLKAPRILTNSSNITVIENNVSFVYISCDTTGYPKPVIEWKFGEVTLDASHGSLPGNTVIHRLDGENVITTSSYQVFNNGTIRIDNPFTKYLVPHENFSCVARNIVGQDSRSHGFNIVKSMSYPFKVSFSKGLANLEENIRVKLQNSFEPLKLFSYNIISVNSTLATAHFTLVWPNKYLLQHYGDPVDVSAVARDVEIALSHGNGTVERLIVIAKPDPPVGLIVDDVTASQVSFSWKRPTKYFEINSYNILLNKGSGRINAKQVPGSEISATLDGLDSDIKYRIQMESVNGEGAGDVSKVVEFRTKADTPLVLIIVLVVVFVFLAILLLVLVLVYRRRTIEKTNPYEESIPGVPLRYISSRDKQTFCPVGTSDASSAQNVFSWYEISRESLTMDKILGQGQFGLVQKAIWCKDDKNMEVPVAIKTVKDDATETNRMELFKELKLMASIEKHRNVVNLVGACSKGGPMWILVEFCENGDLLNYLKKNRNKAVDGSFTTSLELPLRIKIAYDVSKGMRHLQENKIIHRDLAARNILLGENIIAKVSDFGLSRDVYELGLYQKKTGGKLPVRWMAIESLQDGLYNSKSDVWSFGVVFWEIETAGMMPYPGLTGGSDLLEFLLSGQRAKKPTFTFTEIYEIMKTCWVFDPSTRPDFEELEKKLESILMKLSDYLDVFHEDNTNGLDGDAAYINFSVEAQTPPTNPA